MSSVFNIGSFRLLSSCSLKVIVMIMRVFQEDAGMRYNISMINALVMYVGTQVGAGRWSSMRSRWRSRRI